MLRVAMISRSTLFKVKGGDTVQVMQTAKQLTQLGLMVDIKLASEVIHYDQYHLLHFFNITRPADILYHIEKTSVPFVVSTILIDYSEFDKQYRSGLGGKVLRFYSRDSNEYIKTLARALLRKDKLPGMSYIVNGQAKSIDKVLKRARLLLPNSENEYRRLKREYDCVTRYSVIYNGVDSDTFTASDNVDRDDKLVVCAARIEGIKNQLNLIKALNSTSYKLLIIGSPAANQPTYYNACRKAAKNNVTFIGHIPQSELVAYYEKAKVHVLPSWFETTGLSSLEAAAMGCNVVITDKGDAKEYFGDHAFYCDPGSPASIYDAVVKAASQPLNNCLKNKVRNDYTWRQAALKTFGSYQQILQS